MFKLVAVGGKIRGKEIILQEGENTLGRSADCDHQIDVDGVSKKHMRITVNGESAYLEDLGSSNGTIVNGKLVPSKTIYNQDKIALPNVIFQVVYVKENIITIRKKVNHAQENSYSSDDFDDERAPNDLMGKVIYFFRKKLMPVFYSFNEQYEWRVMFGIVLFLFILVNIFLIITPVLKTNKDLLLIEVTKRAEQYAEEVALINRGVLRDKNIDRIETNFLEESGNGVESYELFDKEGRVIRPLSKLNTYSNDSFSTYVLENLNKGNHDRDVVRKLIENGKVGVGLAIRAHDLQTGGNDIVGYIAIKFAPETFTSLANQDLQSYAVAFTLSFLVGIVFFGIVYFLTKRPIDEMVHQIERVSRGKIKELGSSLLMEELDPMRKSINFLFQRLRESEQSESGGMDQSEEDGKYVFQLKEFMLGAQGPAMVLNSEKLIQYLNNYGEDLLGIRENSSSGNSLLDVLREQGIAATIIDLCDQSSHNEGNHRSENYEIGGREYKISVTALIGKDSFAKAFYVTFFEDR
jgi:pSer/pThr/pTyr-binding forkhead associated (FHA) protein